MIQVKIGANGTILLIPNTSTDAGVLNALLYARRSGARWVTWWTYLQDLRRDAGKRLQFDQGAAAALKILMTRTDGVMRGNDQAIRALFAKDAQPHDYQIQGIHAGLNAERLLIADDVGLGKTTQSIGIVLGAFARGLVRRAVIVCPPGLKAQWYEEVYRFAGPGKWPEPTVIVDGTPGQRRTLYRGPWRVLIINPEILLRDMKILAAVSNTVGLVILDEASCIRNGETKIAQAVKYLFSRTRFKVALTATPIENRLADLLSVFQWVDPRVFLSAPYFNKRYIVWKTKRFKVKNKKGQSFNVMKVEPARYINLNEVRQKIRGRYIRRRAKDVGHQLPSLVVKWERVELGARQRAVYESCKEATLAKVKNMRGAALYSPLQGLRQACNSTALVVEGEKKPAQAKVDRLRTLLETELAGEQVIIFTDYERFVRLLAREFKDMRPACYTGQMTDDERRAHLNAFKLGHRRILIATKAGERGHNLQVAGVVVNIDLPFNPAAIKQRVGRARRLGSKVETIRMINMVAVGTIEESLILKRIYGKRRLFEGIMGGDELSDADPTGGLTGLDLRSML